MMHSHLQCYFYKSFQCSSVRGTAACLLFTVISFREHLTKTAGKLKNRNNLLMKLAGSTWGASANTLRLWCFAIQQQSTVPQSGHALLTQVGSMCS